VGQKTARIRALKDAPRKDFNQDNAGLTIAIAALGTEALACIVKSIERSRQSLFAIATPSR
jgi:hypothetical protein